jgi:PIN domain nuclease of toxin-antitoxin system
VTLLLDSHALLWAMHAPEKLSASSRRAIAEGSNAVYFSSASIWELAIKSAKGQLQMDEGFLEAVAQTRFTELPVRAGHAWAIQSLPPIHADPFDRILVAQALTERLTLVTRDQFLDQYRIPVLAA